MFKIHIWPDTLSRYYKLRNIKFAKPKRVNDSKHSDDDLKCHRLTFLTELAMRMEVGKRILFLDESSTHLWESKTRVWTPAKEKISVKRTSTRGHGATLYGVLSLDGEIFT